MFKVCKAVETAQLTGGLDEKKCFNNKKLLLKSVHHCCDIITVKRHGNVMIVIVYQQGNEFSEPIYTPEQIQLRSRPSMAQFFNTFIYYGVTHCSFMPPQKHIIHYLGAAEQGAIPDPSYCLLHISFTKMIHGQN